MSDWMTYLWAFVIGGAFCLIAQILIDKTNLTPARILVLYVCAGVVLGGIGVYGWLVEFAGAGATTPLTGFGFRIAEGVRRAVETEGPTGILTGGLSAASGGITAALFFGLLAAICFRSKPKR